MEASRIAMEASPNRICRVCLTPEDADEFKSLFDGNGHMALKIFRIANVAVLDVNPAMPSLICKKCEADIEAIEKVRLRILDAEEYFCMMTADVEKKFFSVDLKNLIDNKGLVTPKPGKKRNAAEMATPKTVYSKKKKKVVSKSAPTNSRPKGLKLKGAANRKKIASVQRSITMLDESDISESEIFIKPVEEPRFIPNAVPARFGIKRMIAKGKSFFKNMSKLDRKTAANRGGKMAALAARSSPNVITFECDTCLSTFQTSKDLNQHMLTHNERFNCTLCDATLVSADQRINHIRLIHGVMT